MKSKGMVTGEHIGDLMKRSVFEFGKMGKKTTTCLCTLPSGFEIAVSSSCVNPINYDQQAGEDNCRKRVRSKLWELEGYLLQVRGDRDRAKEVEKACRDIEYGSEPKVVMDLLLDDLGVE